MLSLNFSPFPEIRTERLVLRELSYADLEPMYLLRTDPRVIEHFNRAPDASLEATKSKITEILTAQEKNDAIFWVICTKEDPKMIGNIGFWNITKEHYRAETGYLLHPDFWRKGLMKEALIAIIDHAFAVMKIHSIEANINPENSASGALLESCGFVKEAYHRENYYYNGVFYDSIIYARLQN
jgi:[ribosomal protein S5]-alanine N-acetyltransferase